MKKWSIGELQAMRAAARFLLGLGVFTIIVSVWLLVLSLKLTPEEKNTNVHKNDTRDGGIVLVLAVVSVGAGWKLRSYVRKCAEQTGQSSKPFGWMP
jgi:hypothetical protein